MSGEERAPEAPAVDALAEAILTAYLTTDYNQRRSPWPLTRETLSDVHVDRARRYADAARAWCEGRLTGRAHVERLRAAIGDLFDTAASDEDIADLLAVVADCLGIQR